jgi:hypothetical protein
MTEVAQLVAQAPASACSNSAVTGRLEDTAWLSGDVAYLGIAGFGVRGGVTITGLVGVSSGCQPCAGMLGGAVSAAREADGLG